MPLDPLFGAVTEPLSAVAAPSLLLTWAIDVYSAVRLDRSCTAPMPKRRVVPTSTPAALRRVDCAIEAFHVVAPSR